MPDYKLDAETGHYNVTGFDVILRRSVIKKALKKNWWLIGIYVAATVYGLWDAFRGGWYSFCVCLAVAVVTFAAGFWMVETVITITNHER